MIFKSKHIKGDGRGHSVGFPTINLIIPSDLVLLDGVYASLVTIEDKVYKGALHYGPVPTFDKIEKTLEVYLLDINDENVPNISDIELLLNIVQFIRPIQKFESTKDLSDAITLDVEKIRNVLK